MFDMKKMGSLISSANQSRGFYREKDAVLFSRKLKMKGIETDIFMASTKKGPYKYYVTAK